MVDMPSIDGVALHRPPGWDGPGRAGIRHVQADRDRRVVAELADFHGGRGRRTRGVGVWHLDGTSGEPGRLLWWAEAEAACLLPSGDALLVLEYGVRVVRYAWPELTELDEVRVHEYAEDIVVSPSERRFLTWLNDGQGANGYEVYGLAGKLSDLEVGEDMTIDTMFGAPVFSPSDRLVACTHGQARDFGAWWSPDDEDEDAWPDDVEDELAVPGPGGVTTVGWLVIHDIEDDIVSRHELRFDLAPGWLPDHVEDGRWVDALVEPAFPADDRLRLTLADGNALELQLPLPDEVLLPTPSRTLPHATPGRWEWRQEPSSPLLS
jgi:hypothetical protein